MKMNCKLTSTIGFLMIHFLLFGQSDQYQFHQSLIKAKEGWNSVLLPKETYSHIQTNFSDIRIYGKKKGQTTEIEQPYILKPLETKMESKEIKFKTLNETRTGQNDSYTFELSKLESANRISLDFNDKNYDRKVKLEGSNDLKRWSTIGNNFRIVSFKNPRTTFTYSSLDFPDSKFQYFRISFDAEQKSSLRSAYILKYQRQEEDYASHLPKSVVRSENKIQKSTEIEMDLGMKLPLRNIQMTCNSPLDYFRKIRVEGVVDSFETEKGWNYTYRPLGSGMISSEYGNSIDLNAKGFFQKLKVIIYNFDDQPLPLENLTVQYADHQLISRLDDSDEFILCYGSTKATVPRYDISYIQNKIPENTNQLKAGKVTFQPRQKNESPTLFKNQWWLWGIMILIIIILGIFTLNMVKDHNPS